MNGKRIPAWLTPLLFAAAFGLLTVGASFLDRWMPHLQWGIWTEIVLLMICGAALGLERFFWRPAENVWIGSLLRVVLSAAFIFAGWKFQQSVPYLLCVLAGGYELGMAVWSPLKRHAKLAESRGRVILSYIVPVLSGLLFLGVIILFFALFYQKGPTQRFLPIVPYVMLCTAILAAAGLSLSVERLAPQTKAGWGKALCYFLLAGLLFTAGCFGKTWQDQIPFVLAAGYELSIALGCLISWLRGRKKALAEE